MSHKHYDLGGVRELSYDPKYAKPYGQTEEQIHLEAQEPDNHVPKPDRFWLLRFLGLEE